MAPSQALELELRPTPNLRTAVPKTKQNESTYTQITTGRHDEELGISRGIVEDLEPKWVCLHHIAHGNLRHCFIEACF